MRLLKIEKRFKKDIGRDKKSGKYSKFDFDILKNIIDSLLNDEPIDSLYKRHSLVGNLKLYESIHLKNDWVLIFKLDNECLYLVMLGSHSQVYKKIF